MHDAAPALVAPHGRVADSSHATYSLLFAFDLPAQMFFIIGLGLCDEKDITIRGLEVGLHLYLFLGYPRLVRSRLSAGPLESTSRLIPVY